MVDYLMVDFLLILVYLLLAEKHTVKGEQVGGAVAQYKLRRDVQPTGQPGVVHARVQRTRRHVEIGIGCQIGAVLRSGGVKIGRYKLYINHSRSIAKSTVTLTINMYSMPILRYTTWTSGTRMSALKRNIVQCTSSQTIVDEFRTIPFVNWLRDDVFCFFTG